MSQAEIIGFLRHSYVRLRQKQTAVHGIGKVENGDNFGIIDRLVRLWCYLLSEGLTRANIHLASPGISIKEATLITAIS